jgi:aminopeptidase C
MDYAIEQGYTFAWGSDVSEKGFTRDGLCVVPDVEANERSGSDQDRWLGVSREEKQAMLYNLNAPGFEKKITQELRQTEYDNKLTTDDHGMHIFGIAKDQNGTKYYMVKNSWGPVGKYKGIWYASESFVRYKTMNILINKNALPKEIKAKLGIN